MCSEPGQVRFNEGSTKVDKTCRCDFTKGYAFVSTTVNSCHCTPSTEDCSCFLQRCPVNYAITPDYLCIHMNNNSYVPRCPDMDYQERPNVNNTTDRGAYKDNQIKGPRYNREVTAIVISVCLFIILTTIFLLVRDEMPSICYIKILSPRLELHSRDAQLRLSWINKHIEGISVLHFKIMYTHNNWREKEYIYVGKSESSCIIPNVLPEKIYRFTITSCLENSLQSEPSEEVTYNSGSPNPPNELQVVVANRTLKLIWTSPPVNIFIANSYKISYTWNDWNYKDDIIVNATKSSCNIPNILPEKIYKFRIASCLQDSYEGKPSAETLYYSGCKFGEVVWLYP
ncbi:uncharacterized protein LOC127705644 [Mytilus californianus]|uniref:uncharacterized protein LOC127705644 n=1 Tax=Mytilus californianus TaxID=6549 RepID=UPI0022467CB3|nr:uncharacterized protein LOC127705644 [Mytilus californianus]